MNKTQQDSAALQFQANDRAVMRAYGLPATTSESDTVAHLFKLYEQLTNK